MKKIGLKTAQYTEHPKAFAAVNAANANFTIQEN
jgi:hypothetical protein